MTDPEAHGARSGYGWLALAVLILAYVLAFVDRQILNLLVRPIKHDLGLSDVEVSLLQGLSFALFLSVGGLPIGRLVDTGRRTRLLASGIGLWSLATAGCGLARGYLQLLLARIGVGVGEATMTPSAYSLIGDYFPAHRQGLAIGLYSVGAYLGAGLALVIGAEITARVPAGPVPVPLLGTISGWQLIFLLVALPGLVVALLVAALREPKRGGETNAPPTLAEARRWFGRQAIPLVLVNLCVASAAMAMYGLSAWLPTFFERQHGLTAAAAGRVIGVIVMGAGALGTLGAGILGDRQRRAGQVDGRMRVMVSASLAAVPFAIAAPLAASRDMAFLLLVPTFFLLPLAIGSGPATLQEVTPPRLRGLQHALAVFAVNLIGLGLGPTMVALVTDHVLHDEARLSLSLALVCPLALALSAACGLAALAPYRRAMAARVA